MSRGPTRPQIEGRRLAQRFDRARVVDDIERQLRRGRHLVLYGPRGSGKSTALAALAHRLTQTQTPLGYANETRSLRDITIALSRAYPGVQIDGLTQRRLRGRLWRAADLDAGVLLLDHLSRVGTAMVGFLRRLRGGVVGVLAAVDVESPSERDRMRRWHLGQSIRMPLEPPPTLRKLLRARCRASHRLIDLAAERRLLEAARGRVGWIAECVGLMQDPRYWNGGTLLVTLLAIDTEIAMAGYVIPSADKSDDIAPP